MINRALRLSAIAVCLGASAFAASHRNGPLLLEDQTANLNDFYIFRSYEQGRSDRLVMSMSAQGFQNPDNGPSYYKFSDSVLYRFHLNNPPGRDGRPPIQVELVFQPPLRPTPRLVSDFRALTPPYTPGL